MISVNNSLFIIGGSNWSDYSIWKFNFQIETMIQFSNFYNCEKHTNFGMIYNSKNNCLLLFGGYRWNERHSANIDTGDDTDDILEFNITTKQWNKMPVSLPRKISDIACTMVINSEYVLLFGGKSIINKTIKQRYKKK
eukprot:107953_1